MIDKHCRVIVPGKDRDAHLIGVISDTHGLIRPEALEVLKGAELILHAGDIGSPQVLECLRSVAQVVAVRGNIDNGLWAQALPEVNRYNLPENVSMSSITLRNSISIHLQSVSVPSYTVIRISPPFKPVRVLSCLIPAVPDREDSAFR